jgi:hypothetical protein
MKHSSGFITVKILRLKDHYFGTSRRVRYIALNEKTGREIEVKSAQKLRSRLG